MNQYWFSSQQEGLLILENSASPGCGRFEGQVIIFGSVVFSAADVGEQTVKTFVYTLFLQRSSSNF